MSRKKSKNSTPLVLQKQLRLPATKTALSLSQRDVKRLMAAQILCGMLSNPKKEKFETSDLMDQAVECAEKIIDLTA